MMMGTLPKVWDACDKIRHAIVRGRFVPGQRLEPATLADELTTSLTPIRNALYRLSGERLVDAHSRDGFYVPLPTEAALRELYDCMEERLLTCLARGALPGDRPYKRPTPHDGAAEATWRLFDTIALKTRVVETRYITQQANDRLAPIRVAKRSLFPDAHAELDELITAWEHADIPRLERKLRAYHARRIDRVPDIVELLNETRHAPH
ncbi:GntR family transcriptional regulator [Luteimonas sp. RC10]|uniref:GntR family transcriptional regulator n=1 Tax=Luteimonas sp. RC10 TaxID=2587035 RepID=UPI0016172B29|nr:GntR family transcriptional regulator [Luteimonas sp. RC10]MBB3344599.1 hypothetical protein [Luteimonas sp. RC10]